MLHPPSKFGAFIWLTKRRTDRNMDGQTDAGEDNKSSAEDTKG